MKKKGLIISTVVMVVVLIASLTTATYAWFTASTVTSLNGFDVSVISANAVNIGVKTDFNHYLKKDANTTPVSSDAFRTGTVKFSGATAGTIDTGSWADGSSGLSATLDPQIHWGAQNTAMGFTSSTLNDGDNVLAMDTVHDWNGTGSAFKGNKDSATTVKGGKALPNNSGDNGDGNGDYVHFILGVSPTKDLGMNNFVVVVEPTGSSDTLGVLASLHVAYRMTKYNSDETTPWKDVDLYGGKYNSGTRKAAVTTDASTTGEHAKEGGQVFTNNTQLSAAYTATYGAGSSAPQGSIAYQIKDLDTDKDAITQLEVVIYMSGSDADCNDQGKTSAGSIKMFFNTQERSSALTKAEYTLTNANKTMEVEVTGLSTTSGTEVYYQIGNASAQKANLSGNKFTITSETAITPTDVKVYQKEPEKAPSDLIAVTPKK